MHSKKVRTFAITLHFYSASAYNYVRKSYLNKLPHPRTIRKWYQSINGNPGCTSESLFALKIRTAAAAKNGKKIICNLIMDEMAIRRQIIFNNVTKQFSGFCDFGAALNKDDKETEKKEAKEVLVFLVNAVNDLFKIPVSHFFINGLMASDKANLLNEVLIFLSAADIEIAAVTFDGAPANILMAKILGVSLNISNMRPWFSHPVTKKPFGIFMDICHMLKLIRNTLASHRVFYDNKNREIK